MTPKNDLIRLLIFSIKVRFGKTELMMPIITCGGMRQQFTWKQQATTSNPDITKECDANFQAIVDRWVGEHCTATLQESTNVGTCERGYGRLRQSYSGYYEQGTRGTQTLRIARNL